MTDLTKITTPLGLLDPETRAALEAHGGPYQAYACDGWRDRIQRGIWYLSTVYRVKPSPPKPREFVGFLYSDGRHCMKDMPKNGGVAWSARAECLADETIRLIEWPEGADLPDMPEGV